MLFRSLHAESSEKIAACPFVTSQGAWTTERSDGSRRLRSRPQAPDGDKHGWLNASFHDHHSINIAIARRRLCTNRTGEPPLSRLVPQMNPQAPASIVLALSSHNERFHDTRRYASLRHSQHRVLRQLITRWRRISSTLRSRRRLFRPTNKRCRRGECTGPTLGRNLVSWHKSLSLN